MGITRQGIKTASSGLPDIQPNQILSSRNILPSKFPTIIRLFYVFKNGWWEDRHFVWGRFESRNCAGTVTNPKVTRINRVYERPGPGPKGTKDKPSPQHNECPEENSFLVILDKRHKIKVLLDSAQRYSSKTKTPHAPPKYLKKQERTHLKSGHWMAICPPQEENTIHIQFN